MARSPFVILNGKYMLADDVLLTAQNRAFRYGDGVFESMHASGSTVQFYYEHLERLIRAMKLLKMEVPLKLTVDSWGLHEEISKLLIKNQYFLGARIRLNIFRNDGGLYKPATNEISYLIETEKLQTAKYELNYNGLRIDIYDEIPKPVNFLSNFKTTNSLINVLAGISATERKFDDVLLVNEFGNPIEATGSNLFIVKNDVIYTPSLTEGCVDGIMRKQIIKIARELNFEVFDDCILSVKNLIYSDEIFLTNAVRGITWVSAFRDRRYFNRIAKQLSKRLNEITFDNKPEIKEEQS